jgi:hypothetical protein
MTGPGQSPVRNRPGSEGIVYHVPPSREATGTAFRHSWACGRRHIRCRTVDFALADIAPNLLPALRRLAQGSKIKFGCAVGAPSGQLNAMLLRKVATEANSSSRKYI